MASIVLPFVTTFDDKGVKNAQSSLLGLTKTNLIAGASVGAVIDQLSKAVTAAAEDAEQQKQLQIAIQNNTDATGAQAAAVEDMIGKMQFQKAVSDGELRPALGNLVRATQDVTKAQELLGLALDISAGTGKDLQTVSIALAKAQTGNIGALTRLGIPLDATAVKSKDLGAIQADLADRFKGASDAAANSAAGGMRKLQIALDEAYETVGNAVIPIMEDYVVVLGDLAEKTLRAEGNSKGFGSRLKDLVVNLSPVARILETVNNLVGQQADKTRQAEIEANRLNQVTSRITKPTKEYTTAVEDNTDKTNKNADAKKKAREAAQKYADTLRERVKTALESVNDEVKTAQTNFDNYADSLADIIKGSVSLGDAFKTQQDAEKQLADALKDRADAYASLNKLNPTEEAEAYADALERVRDAEKGVTAAQKLRAETDYTKVFQDKIAASQRFAEKIQWLIQNQGLQQAGVAELLNLGPEVGNIVAGNMIDGVGGFTSAVLNEQLANLATSAGNLGMAGANAFFGAALTGATGRQGQVNQYSITVNAGLVSNPAQVGRDIIEAIKQAERVSGIVFQPA